MSRLMSYLSFLFILPAAHGQLLSDPSFDASVASPAFPLGEGPSVVIDEGHNNWHTGAGRYKPFADTLRSDGYRVSAHEGLLTTEALESVAIVVIASAIADGATADPSTWILGESALSDGEITLLVDWVRTGGALFLVTDYMPIAGWSADLAAGFGIHIADGYAYNGRGEAQLLFSRDAGTLRDHAITNGRNSRERINSFRTFAGTALLAPYGAEPLLLFDSASYIVMPESGILPDTPPPADAPRHSIGGWSQGAVMDFGNGHLAVFGEAASFSAQRYADGQPMGMNDPQAVDNKQFLLNVVHWLSGIL